MSKKKRVPKTQPPGDSIPPVRMSLRRGMTKTLLLGVALCLVVTSAALTRNGALHRTLGLSSLGASAAPQTQATPTLSKEYIYAGGRLIATEEPSPTLPPPSTSTRPTGLKANRFGSGVKASWGMPATSGTVEHYIIERKSSGGTTLLTHTSPAFVDSTPPQGKVLRYRVQAKFTNGVVSDFSDADIANTIVFADDPVTGGVTPIKAEHVRQLREAAEDAHACAGLGPITWSQPPPVPGTVISAVDLDEVETYMKAARAAMGVFFQPSGSMKGTSYKGKSVMASTINYLRGLVS